MLINFLRNSLQCTMWVCTLYVHCVYRTLYIVRRNSPRELAAKNRFSQANRATLVQLSIELVTVTASWIDRSNNRRTSVKTDLKKKDVACIGDDRWKVWRNHPDRQRLDVTSSARGPELDRGSLSVTLPRPCCYLACYLAR